jgi:hypothetical protein
MEKNMNLWRGETYLDDRLFILDLQQAKKGNHEVWAVTTRRNIKGFPPFRVDDFKTKEEAVSFLKGVEPSTPRISLHGKSPTPVPTYEEYLRWCDTEDIPSSMHIHRLNQRDRGERIIEELKPEKVSRKGQSYKLMI